MNASVSVDSLNVGRWDSYPPLSRFVYVVITVVMLITFILGSFGNTLIIVLFVKYKSLRTTPNVLIINLTVANLVLCMLCVPIIIANCLNGYVVIEINYYVCNAYAFVAAFVGFVDILSLTAIAIDRCLVITKRMFRNRPGNRSFSHSCILAILCVSVICASAPVFGFGRYVRDASEIYCTFDFFTFSVTNVTYNVSIQVLFLYSPLVIMVLCYGRIFFAVRKHGQRYFRHQQAQTTMEKHVPCFRRTLGNRNFVKTEVTVARASLVTILAFLLSWAPYAIVVSMCLFGDDNGITRLAATIPEIFAKVSTIYNPLIYALLHKHFKSKLKTLYINTLKSVTSVFSPVDVPPEVPGTPKIPGNNRSNQFVYEIVPRRDFVVDRSIAMRIV